MKKAICFILPVLAVLALVFSCQRRPLWYHDSEGLKVLVKVLWKVEVYPDGQKPDGITLFFFKDGEFYMQQSTSNVDSCTVQLESGKYQLYMITQSPEEYGRMEFENLTDFQNASVSAIETESKWYTRAEGEELIANPEMMSVGVSDVFEVTEEMVQNYQHYNHILQSQTKAEQDSEAEAMVKYYTILVPVQPKSIVSQYWVTIYSDNADVLMSVRASTSGMARTFELTQDVTGEEEATQFITQWTLTIDDPARRVGHIDGRITTFGFPNGETPSMLRDSTLNVSALLIDEKTQEDYVFNVGDKITSEDPPLGYRALYRLIFGSVEAPAIHPPDVPPPGAEGGGFTAGVTDWDEEMIIDIPI